MSQRPRRQSLRSVLSLRDGRSWAARGLVVLIFVALGYLGVANSLANVVAKVQPGAAHALAPGSGVLMARYAEKAFAQAPKTDPGSPAADLARRALLADPTAASALTVLGMQAQLRGDAAQARRIFAYSTALSRRELRPRLWAIEEAVIRGDIATALRNYDIALRTSTEANNLLFPTLAAALSEPRIRAELLPVLSKTPVWRKDFLAYVAHSGVEPEGAMALFAQERDFGLSITDDVRADLVNALALRNKHDKAWTYYRSFRSEAQRDRSRDPRFATLADARTVFDWQEGADARLAAILREGGHGVLELTAPSNNGGEVISQTQLLPAGTYNFEGRSRGLRQPERSRPYWSLTCLDGRELGRVAVSNSDKNDGRFSGRFIVPPACTVQKLALIVRPSDDITGVTGQIERAQLVPAG